MAQFPKFAGHATATCFKCDRPLVEPVSTDNAPGRGQYRAHCDECRMFTWYDLGASKAWDSAMSRLVGG